MNWKLFRGLEDFGVLVFPTVTMELVRRFEKDVREKRDAESLACWVHACYTRIGDVAGDPTATAAMWGYYDATGRALASIVKLEEPYYYPVKTWHQTVIAQLLASSPEHSTPTAMTRIRKHFRLMGWNYDDVVDASRRTPEETVSRLWGDIPGDFSGCHIRLTPNHPTPVESLWVDVDGCEWRVDSQGGKELDFLVITRFENGELIWKRIWSATLLRKFSRVSKTPSVLSVI